MPVSTLEGRPCREGALDDETRPPHSAPTPDILAALEELDASPARPTRGRPEGVHSVSHLIAEKNLSRDLDRFKKAARALVDTDTATLILKIHSTQDPLMLWAIHMALDKRGVPPALRWPANTSTEQMKFIGWQADIFWFTRRNPHHRPKFRGWVRLLTETPGSQTWLQQAYWIFAAMYDRQNVSSYTARGLALTPEHRQPLMMLPTSRMVTARLQLQASPFAETRERLLSHAVANPDKSGKYTPEAIGQRRAALWRTFILSGKSPTATGDSWKLLSGESITRQAISRQLDTVKAILQNDAADA